MRNRKIVVIFFLAISHLSAVTRIGIELDANLEFDLSLSIYPPLIFPAYYYPTFGSTTNPQGIQLTVSYQRIGTTHSVSNLYLATKGSGNFSPSILLSQLYFAPDGEPIPPNGQEPPGSNWRAYSIFYQTIEQFPVSGPGLQTFPRPQDFIFKAEPDDELGNWTVTLYYRVYGL